MFKDNLKSNEWICENQQGFPLLKSKQGLFLEVNSSRKFLLQHESSLSEVNSDISYNYVLDQNSMIFLFKVGFLFGG